MSTIKVYDTQGNRISADGKTGETDETIREYFPSGLRFAIDTRRNVRLVVFFRATKYSSSRSEQFYAVCEPSTSSSNTLKQFARDLRQLVEEEWDYSIDTNIDEMAVYRELTASNANPPGSKAEHDIITTLVDQRRHPVVGVKDARSGLALLTNFLPEYGSAAIVEDGSSGIVSEFDLVVVPSKGPGLTPLGDTREYWENAKEQVGDEILQDKVTTIRDEVQELSNSWDYSDQEIRKEVYNRVPTLRPAEGTTTTSRSNRNTNGGTSTSSGGWDSGSSNQTTQLGGSNNDNLLDDDSKAKLVLGILLLFGVVLIVAGLLWNFGML